MIIAKSRTRFLTMVASLVFFIIISILTYHNSGFLNALMQLDHSIAQTVIPNWLENFMKPFYFFSHGFGLFLITFLIIFFLWGFKFKIPATWILITSIGGWLLALVWLQFSENGYRVYAPDFYRRRGFSNSWY